MQHHTVVHYSSVITAQRFYPEIDIEYEVTCQNPPEDEKYMTTINLNVITISITKINKYMHFYFFYTAGQQTRLE